MLTVWDRDGKVSLDSSHNLSRKVGNVFIEANAGASGSWYDARLAGQRFAYTLVGATDFDEYSMYPDCVHDGNGTVSWSYPDNRQRGRANVVYWIY
jgi:hypothetical protein